MNAINSLETVFAGLQNYDATFGHLPPANDNAWRFDEITGIKRVTWRGAIIDSIAAIGDRSGELSNEKIARQIDEVGSNYFCPNGTMIYSRFPTDGRVGLTALPAKSVIAFTATRKDGSSWLADDSVEFETIANGANWQRFPIAGMYLLFADGSIGFLPSFDRSALTTLENTVQTVEQLRKVGVDVVKDRKTARPVN